MSTRPLGATPMLGWRVWVTMPNSTGLAGDSLPGLGVASLISLGVDQVAPLLSERWKYTSLSGGMKWSWPAKLPVGRSGPWL
jgi:hypothetical protein